MQNIEWKFLILLNTKKMKVYLDGEIKRSVERAERQREREREREGMVGGREKPSTIWAVSPEPYVGLELRNPEIMP